jgi:four helix bundle protein
MASAKNQVPRTKYQRREIMACKINKLYKIIEIAPVKFEVKESGAEYAFDLKKRTFDFAVDIIRFLKTISYKKENDVIKYQLAKSGTSVGANYEEAQATGSRADFRHKISIVLKEARESNYWLRIMQRTHIGNQEAVAVLVQESYELRNIFGAIYNKVAD